MLTDPFGTCPGGVAQNRDSNQTQSQDSKSGGPSNADSDSADPQGIGSSIPPGPCRGFTDQGGGGGVLGSDPFFNDPHFGDGEDPFAASLPLLGGGGFSVGDSWANNFTFGGWGVGALGGGDLWLALSPQSLCGTFVDEGIGKPVTMGGCDDGYGGQYYFPPMTATQFVRTVVAQARPSACGGGVFFYVGAEGEKTVGGVKTQAFLGYLGEWDSNSGWSNNGLFEVGTPKATGGAAANSQGGQGLLFVPFADFGGFVASKTSLGVYAGTPGRLGIGGGTYVNITTASGCQTLRSH
jgi:hypothetical protein